jgi:hypothetical protein
MTYRHGFVRLKSRARRQVQRKTWNSGERPGHSLMTAFLKFANLADIVLARDSAAVQLWHVVKVRAAGFGVSCAVYSRSYSTTPWSETTIEDRCSIAIPALRPRIPHLSAGPAMPVLREGGMIRDIAVEPEPAEPPVRQIEVDLFAEASLGARISRCCAGNPGR